ncbi:MAG: hypothetical protein AAB842_02250 [Patescibacteria group bacterium]
MAVLNFSFTEQKNPASQAVKAGFFAGGFKKINEQIKILPMKQRQEIKRILE